jgi:hypothetical protein
MFHKPTLIARVSLGKYISQVKGKMVHDVEELITLHTFDLQFWGV